MRRRWRRILLVVAVGVLAAVAVPSVLPQKKQASDAGARALARTASTAAETIATEHEGSFTSVSLATIGHACGSAPCLTSATGTRGNYSVTARSASGDTFTITGDGTAVRRSCTGSGCRW